jgi:hypothetical protein
MPHNAKRVTANDDFISMVGVFDGGLAGDGAA